MGPRNVGAAGAVTKHRDKVGAEILYTVDESSVELDVVGDPVGSDMDGWVEIIVIVDRSVAKIVFQEGVTLEAVGGTTDLAGGRV